MKATVYIETTIPSFYFEGRSDPSMVARREWTREWWESRRHLYSLVTSIAVIEELEAGNHPRRTECLSLISGLQILPMVDRIVEIVDKYVQHHVMPSDPRGDALHLALASYHQCQFLLTWNCAHLANANKIEHIRYVNTLQGLPNPILTTPLELMSPKEPQP